ncbi:sensor histidine kinase [Microbacterium indicum]|uniref:sensor histidine kinase n=1 Tax=Microbacterium indicum TaxID=358100 RepID=UPI0004243897|nr:histidine kinase [Microbacterium indicum]
MTVTEAAPLRYLRAAPTPRQLRADLWLALALFAAAVVCAILQEVANYGFRDSNLAGMFVTAACTALPLALRRRAPIVVALVTNIAYVIGAELGAVELYVSQVMLFLSIYTIGAWVTDRTLAMRVRVLIIGAMFVWLAISTFRSATEPIPDEWADFPGAFTPMLATWFLTWLTNMAYFGAAYYAGNRAYSSALDAQALADRTRELEGQQELAAAQAVALDRVRIARELHDVVAHHVSTMGVQAGAARAVVDANPEGAKQALLVVEDSAREAIGEMRRLLDTLRAGDDAEEPPSTVGLESLDPLARSVTAVGVPTSLRIIGDPRPVPAFAQVNLYRIAQEALTNARRHGGPDVTADVRLRYLDGAVELEVANTGRVALSSRTGLGTIGMRERATAMGGSVEIGPRTRGGYLVRVRVPLT